MNLRDEWTVLTDAWGYSARFLPFDDSSYLYAYLSRLVWAAPAMALIIRYNGTDSEPLILQRC